MGDQQDDYYSAQRAGYDRRFQELPQAGTHAYWQAIEHAAPGDALPLEVLGRCLRERHKVGAQSDAERIFAVIMGRIQARTQHWAHGIAQQAHSGQKPQLAEDLEIECYASLWEELTDDGPTFLLEKFLHALSRVEQHAAHDIMEKLGEWKRLGVAHPTRVPPSELERLDAPPRADADAPTPRELPYLDAATDFERVEQNIDLNALFATLDVKSRELLHDVFWRDLTQDQIADKLGVSDRTVRKRLNNILSYLRTRYLGGEEGHRG